MGAPHTPMVLAVGAPSVLRINLHTRAHGTASLFPPPCFIDATFVFASLQIQLTWNDVTSVITLQPPSPLQESESPSPTSSVLKS